MAAGILEGREALTIELQRQLAVLAGYLSLAGQNNLSSSHVAAETTAKGLLNRVYGWKLVNANTISQNYPGVDLIDTENSIAVQVTANQTVKKVRETLEKVGKRGVWYDRLIVLFLTNDKPTQGMRECTVPTYSGSMEVWNLADVLRDAKELDPVSLDALTKYMEAELGTIRERVKELPHLELPPVSALPPTGFVGREPELAEIAERFAQGDRMVVLTGLGGMGKTELAARYGREHPGMVYFVRFDTNFTRTISNMVHGIRPKLGELELKVDEAILRKKVLTLLEQARPEDLLIIDNADSPTGALAELLRDEDFKTIEGLNLKLLVTTRSDYPRAIEVRPMPEGPLFKIFENHGTELDAREKLDLIRAVNGHTLTVDLIARTIADNWVPVSAREMLDAIANSTLSGEDFPEVGTDYNRDPEQLHIYQRLLRVFQLAKVPPLERTILRCATLLPEAGMDVGLFRRALTEEQRRVFPRVGRQGWLSAEHKVLTIHPIIRLICRTELKPTDADCEAFLDGLWAQYDQTKYNYAHYSQMAELFTVAHDQIGSHHGKWLNRGGIIWNTLNEDQTLHDMYHSRILALEKVLLPDSAELATAYNYYGLALGALGSYRDELVYEEKALAIRKAVLPENDPDLARSYNNVGDAYEDLGDYRKALEYKRKAMTIFEEVLPADDPDLAISYDHVGSTYGRLGDHKCALEYHLKALMIREKVLPIDHPDLATTYNNVGGTYYDLGDYKRTLEYHLKALAIREKVLPADHTHLATSYNNVGYIYGELGDKKRALEYHLKALTIREKVPPADHPDLAVSYSNMGSTYGKLGDKKRALEYHLKALTIREKVLPADHPDLAVSYSNMGSTYGDLGDHKRALEYHLKDLSICEKVLSADHPDLAISCNNIAWTYYELKKLPEAARYMRRAADIISRSTLPKTHPDRINIHKWAAELEKEAKMEQAIRATMQDFGTMPPGFPFGKK